MKQGTRACDDVRISFFLSSFFPFSLVLLRGAKSVTLQMKLLEYKKYTAIFYMLFFRSLAHNHIHSVSGRTVGDFFIGWLVTNVSKNNRRRGTNAFM